MSPYSPERRTALVLGGTGAHGAYHAGVLRALQEAGVKIDVLAGHGVGAASAALAAIDGAPRLWDVDGLWRDAHVRTLYRFKRPLRAARWAGLAVGLALLAPIAALALGLIVLPLGFLLQMLGASAGATLVNTYSSWLATAFAAENLPTLVPRIAMIAVGVLVLILAGGVAAAQWRAPLRRRAAGGWWWRLAGAPLDAETARERFVAAVWGLIRGVAAVPQPTRTALGRRYAEMLAENLGQPGFRELLLIATDLDARRDLVAVLLAEPFRHEFLAPRAGRDRRSEVLDLAGVGRDHAMDLVAAAVTPPVACDPHLIGFATDSFWRGETHRLCDRPGICSRLLEEVAAAGATQIIVVSAIPPAAAPHHLRAPRLDVRGRLGDFLEAAEMASLRDALEMARLRFDSVYVIAPAHNPVGPFDFEGAYDKASDRRHELAELMERAYEDAYRQFIEPIVGASGEALARPAGSRAGEARP